MHRRGFKDRIESNQEEQLLGQMILGELEKAGTPGYVSFDDPVAILVVETVGRQAGLAVWTREDFNRFPLLRVD